MSKVTFEPHGKTVEVRDGGTILAAARAAKVLLPSKCGGRGACTTCKVLIKFSTPPSELSRMEKHMLSDRMIKDGYRLGCQCKVTGDAEVTIPEDPLRRTIRLQLEAQRREKEENERQQG
ncbi:2Fe-2S iron-sulfur cluster-binding protein [Tumebacillus permanentifrigoris]|uniref:2Fe-2S ferredoxin n=1 Tax=Tumebacillus permanentifrigoris TaxID=378543 RepID=A0A316DD73_9BACL|nr:2Fe-2S iron-sulfur cluster-binding protein [Tumebacillus permanentifrigoris]PWK15915.1 2Fe-2S ferredoxin [Tumebacillus permanentifrigoris]